MSPPLPRLRPLHLKLQPPTAPPRSRRRSASPALTQLTIDPKVSRASSLLSPALFPIVCAIVPLEFVHGCHSRSFKARESEASPALVRAPRTHPVTPAPLPPAARAKLLQPLVVLARGDAIPAGRRGQARLGLARPWSYPHTHYTNTNVCSTPHTHDPTHATHACRRVVVELLCVCARSLELLEGDRRVRTVVGCSGGSPGLWRGRNGRCEGVFEAEKKLFQPATDEYI